MAAPEVQAFERLGAFYLGKTFDVAAGRATDELVAAGGPRDELLLYDSRDLTTHAVCVGMTGSGKTGLCIALLEEAAIDGVPAIAIDPKGDLADLLLTFPGLAPSDFRPWVDPGEAARRGLSLDDHAAAVARTWREGLAEWGQDGARIARFREAVDLAVYTPGSDAGIPIAVLRSLDAPSSEIARDREALAERIQSATSGLLALVGRDADPLKSRESILVASLLQAAWSEGRGLELADLIRGIQRPPFDRLGVLDLESFFPMAARNELALALNGVLAAPGFDLWLEGEPLDAGRLLYGPSGKPKLSIVSIAHLSDAERMFFVTLLLEEVIGWMRRQPGTSSLRAILFMDEIFGYFPPTAEPPSKRPMLTLLKQARAYGLGVVLATQNPVDLDYKGLANAGTWFVGRLQTERDKQRLLDGLEGAIAGAGKSFDRAALDRTLSGLGQRVFLMNDVHEDRPVTFQTRWTLSYLRGPLTREQLRQLKEDRPAAPAPAAVETPRAKSADARARMRSADPRSGPDRPVLPEGVEELFLASAGPVASYRPALRCRARLHFVDAKAKVDAWTEIVVTAPLAPEEPAIDWSSAEVVRAQDAAGDARREPAAGAVFAPMPARAAREASYAQWTKALATHLYQAQGLTLRRSREPALVSKVGESEADFRVRAAQALREARDAEIEALRKRHAPKVRQIADKIRRAEERVARESAQLDQQRTSTWISAGTTLLGSLLGRKAVSAASAQRASSTLRSFGRQSKEKEDVERARTELEVQRKRLAELEAELEGDLAGLRTPRPDEIVLEEVVVRPRKADVEVERPCVLWIPGPAPAGP